MNLREVMRATILDKQINIDKNLRDYLVLKLDNEKTVFSFPNKMSQEKWDRLMNGKTYDFIVEENEKGYLLLIDFAFAV